MKTEKVDLPRTQAGHSLPCECGVRQLEAARGRGQVMAGQATFPFAMNEQRAVVGAYYHSDGVMHGLVASPNFNWLKHLDAGLDRGGCFFHAAQTVCPMQYRTALCDDSHRHQRE